jgi:hypothetical protein
MIDLFPKHSHIALVDGHNICVTKLLRVLICWQTEDSACNWCPLPNTIEYEQLRQLCVAWAKTMQPSMSLQEFLDGCKH